MKRENMKVIASDAADVLWETMLTLLEEASPGSASLPDHREMFREEVIAALAMRLSPEARTMYMLTQEMVERVLELLSDDEKVQEDPERAYYAAFDIAFDLLWEESPFGSSEECNRRAKLLADEALRIYRGEKE